MTPVRRAPAAATAAPALVARCGDPEAGSPAPTGAAVEPSDEPSPTPPSYSPLVAEAVADLAATRGVDEGSIELVAEEEVTWRDGSLGCAKRGMMYTQALVDGSRIVLRLAGTDYEYHSGG